MFIFLCLPIVIIFCEFFYPIFFNNIPNNQPLLSDLFLVISMFTLFLLNFNFLTFLIWFIYLLLLVGHLCIGFLCCHKNTFLNKLTYRISLVINIISPLIFVFCFILWGVYVFLISFWRISINSVISSILIGILIFLIFIFNLIPFYYFFKKTKKLN